MKLREVAFRLSGCANVSGNFEGGSYFSTFDHIFVFLLLLQCLLYNKFSGSRTLQLFEGVKLSQALKSQKKWERNEHSGSEVTLALVNW